MSFLSKYVLTTFFLVLFLGAIILGPILYLGLVWISPIPFHRAMDRALLISSVAALGLFWRRIPFGKLWPLHREVWLSLLLGLVFAAVSVQAMIALNLAVNGFTMAHLTAHEMRSSILLALVAALLAPPLEETVFRGFLQSELIKSLGWRWGWVIAAVIYTLAHFLKVPNAVDHEPVHLWSGAVALGEAFQPLANGDFLSGRGLNLFLAGLILGGIFLRAGSLWVNAGLHGGWILALLLFPRLTVPAPNPPFEFFKGDILSSPLTSVVLILLGLWLWRFYRHPSILLETGENAP